MCAALANVEEDNWEWQPRSTPSRVRTTPADQDAVETGGQRGHRRGCSTWRRWACCSTDARGPHRPACRFGGHTRDHGKALRPPGLLRRRPHRVAGRSRQTLYQNCVKHDVEFFNEFYALDIALTETPAGPVATGVIAYELATGDIHVFHAKAIVSATAARAGCTRPPPTPSHPDRVTASHHLPQGTP